MKFCPYCQMDLAMPEPPRCSHCRAEVADDHSFCHECGKDLSATPEAECAVQATVPPAPRDRSRHVPITVRLTQPQRAWVVAQAKACGQSIHHWLSRLIDKGVDISAMASTDDHHASDTQSVCIALDSVERREKFRAIGDGSLAAAGRAIVRRAMEAANG